MDSTLSSVQDWTMFISQLATRLASGTLRSRESEVPFWAWQDELARLRVWAHDIGLYQAGHTSLDERLSQIPPVKSQISRQMARIRRLVRDIEEELSYPDQSDSMDTDTDSELEDDKVTKPTTTLQDIYTNLKDSIDVLNRMSNIEISRREIAAASLRNSRTAQQTVEGVNLQQEKSMVANHRQYEPRPRTEVSSLPEREQVVLYYDEGGCYSRGSGIANVATDPRY